MDQNEHRFKNARYFLIVAMEALSLNILWSVFHVDSYHAKLFKDQIKHIVKTHYKYGECFTETMWSQSS